MVGKFTWQIYRGIEKGHTARRRRPDLVNCARSWLAGDGETLLLNRQVQYDKHFEIVVKSENRLV